MRRLAIALALLFTVLNTANAINKGGDADVFFEGGRRLLAAAPLYEGSSAAAGFIGPPFQALFFAPFAAVGGVTAKIIWHLINVAALFVGIWLTWRTWSPIRARIGLPPAPVLRTILIALLAVLVPVQTNFEHQNMNALLLALLAGATWQLTFGSAIAAGALIGSATALKAFPILLVLYLAFTRQWLALLSAIVTTVTLTLLPILVYGPAAFLDFLETFWRLANSGWPARGNNQSLVAALERVTSGFDASGVRVPADAPLAATLFVGIAVVLAVALIVVLASTPRSRQQDRIPCEVAAVTILAILLSPIAWDHYWTLMFPAFLIAYDSQDPKLLGGAGRYAFWTAAALTTLLSPLTLGSAGFNVARQLSTYTIAGLIMYASMLRIGARIR
jgi:alpha-1,2-mannosyltransferase